MAVDYAPVLDYIAAYWERITHNNPQDRETLIGLPRPYIVPAAPQGNAMFQEMYYWDSFFITLGLYGTPHEERITDIAENMAYLLRRFGVIPNGTRYYFLSRSQPPFFMALVRMIAERIGADDAWLAEMLALAVGEHERVWHGTQQPHHRLVYRGLSRYFDINYLDMLASGESGWDHSTRCEDRWLEHLPVDLNSILYSREQDFAWAYDKLGKADEAAAWRKRADERATTIRELMWDEVAGFFYDYDYAHQRHDLTNSLAGFYPLWAGLATAEQAARVVETWLPRFEFPAGLVTSLDAREGRQWAYPNGWAPLQWIVAEGLDRYGYHDAAQRVRRKWNDACAHIFARTGALWEKVNVVTPDEEGEGGLYGHVQGFGWTNAVFVDFARKLGG